MTNKQPQEIPFAGLTRSLFVMYTVKQINQNSNRLLERNIVSSNRSNSLIERILEQNKDVINQQWVKRHAKYCYLKGVPAYMELVDKARKYGKNPEALLTHLISKELDKQRS